MMASSAVNSPILNTMTNGIKITNSGMVCNVSMIGRMILETVSLSEAQMPMSVPRKNEIKTAMPHK